jgi:hypothetical protein
MAGATGLEPAASGVTGRRYNQLNYAPIQAGAHYKRSSQFLSRKNLRFLVFLATLRPTEATRLATDSPRESLLRPERP